MAMRNAMEAEAVALHCTDHHEQNTDWAGPPVNDVYYMVTVPPHRPSDRGAPLTQSTDSAKSMHTARAVLQTDVFFRNTCPVAILNAEASCWTRIH